MYDTVHFFLLFDGTKLQNKFNRLLKVTFDVREVNREKSKLAEKNS